MLEYLEQQVEDLSTWVLGFQEIGGNFKLIPGSYEILFEDCGLLHVPQIKPAFVWWKKVVQPLWRECLRLWQMQTESQWRRDFLWDHSDQRHMRLLSEAVVILAKALRKQERPDFFKKGKRDVWFKNLRKED
jgi:hypothetical protein